MWVLLIHGLNSAVKIIKAHNTYMYHTQRRSNCDTSNNALMGVATLQCSSDQAQVLDLHIYMSLIPSLQPSQILLCENLRCFFCQADR